MIHKKNRVVLPLIEQSSLQKHPCNFKLDDSEDIPRLYNLAVAIIDYRGHRVVAQKHKKWHKHHSKQRSNSEVPQAWQRT